MNTSRTSTSFLYPLLSWNFVLRLLFIGLFLVVSLANTFAIKVRNDNAWASVRIHYWNGGTGSDWGSRPTMTAATTPAWDTSGKSWVEWNINTCTDIKLTGTNEPPSTNDINGVSNDGCYTMSSDATPTLTRVDCATGGAYVPPVPVINFAVTGEVIADGQGWTKSPSASRIFEQTGTNTYSLCFIYDSKAFKLLRKENGLPNTDWGWSSAVAIVAGSNVSGSSGDLTITGFTTGDPVCLQLVVSGTTYTLSAEQSVHITSDLPNPINQGADITLTANNVSSACTWEYSTDGGTTWQPYTGATSGTYNEEISPSPLTNMTYRVTSDGKTATYMVQVVINCQGSIQTHFTETFGTLPTATARTTSPHIYSSVYQYSPEGKEVHDGWYAVVANPRNCGRGTRQSTIVDGVVTVLGNVRTSGDYWYNDRTDHTGDTHGGMLFVNCKNKGEIIYQRTITGLCANIYMNFSAWFANAAVPSSTAPINTQFRILDQNGDEIQSARINVNNIKASDGWVHGSTAFFSGANTELTLQIINNGEAGVGNDILIDDILFTSCVPKLSIQAGLEVECGLVTELSVEHDGINTVFNGAPFYLWQQWNYTTGKWDDIADDPVPGSSSKKGSGWDKKYYDYTTEYGGPNIPQFRVIMSSDISVARSVGQDIFPVCHNYAITDIAFADCVCSPQTITRTSGNASQTVCEGSPIGDVVYTYGGVKTTGADVIDLPAGLSYSVNPATKELTISGTPTATGTAKIFAVGIEGEACVSDTLTFTVSFHPTITLTCPPTANVVACNGSHAGAVTLAAFVTQGGATNATGIDFLDGIPSVVGCTETVVRTYTATLNLCERTCTQEIVRTVDTTGPTADALPELGPFACYSEIPVPDIDDVTNVSDNCGGSVAVSHLSDGANPGLNGTVIRTYRLEDSCGNFTDIFQNISIVQPATPAIECYETATWNSVTCVWDVTGTQPVQPAIECYETATWNPITCIWDITGSQPAAPTVECYETATWNPITCVWDITGSQPAAPTVECYETATWNSVTCVWDITGSQPAAPTVECYETATWNGVTCVWDVTGSQPIQPAIECYETATWNGVTCVWDVTGSQPVQPAIECYETATWNPITCVWDITGSQPAAPTVECYETATWNGVTCVWNVTGTQPVQPAIECYETATWNPITCVWDITGSQPVQPAIACYETATWNSVTCDYDITGSQPAAPTVECYETATWNSVTCVWDITGSQPATPAIECYETATWNSVSCVWDVTGTQPVQPAIECYETATWNGVTCVWDITGSQPVQPAIACYETATWNGVTCVWDVTGSQPIAPAIECYETATWNPITCVWDITGSQPAAPTVECYETATWNSVTCVWDITGSQPIAPAIECYETATWNPITCVWDITGSQPAAPTIECYETATWNSVTCDYDITGSQPAAPTVECYETATWNGVTCVWDVTGSQPVQPAIECYETATWNGVTCVWDITGSQPIAPAIECYETATWNGVTCMWDITGSQPVQPAIACYETATWNGVTCVWDITGSQPVQPAIECYETATWNPITCIWDITGSQPAAPAIECYETATWNGVTCVWDVTGSQPIAPAIECYETATWNSVTCDYDITGSQPAAPTVECYETATWNGVTCVWDVTGTQPVQPAIECYETATWNPITCIWDITGSQPAAPTVECYETATWNSVTCVWDVTGSQPAAPTVECYETATWNGVTCVWDVTGTQPVQPAIECYETATWNPITCVWDITGSQPAAPTVECYETATWNGVTCVWDVTGTQPVQPAIECYETATWNGVTCVWDVTGSQPAAPAVECYETATWNGVTCVWDVTGTQPVQPAMECYETATWNPITCVWDITGSQPAAPTVECYETATWNGVTCVWDVTGSQPIQPAIECYETATWNGVTCVWDITGSQPVAPAIECYETATWNPITCVWDITGSQPAAPTVECYETATWNSVTCVWDITGSQPVQPAIECYETATWNGVTCVWDITGSQPIQPAIECYETATWNGVTCVWDITGSQPVQPAIACYETATWNGVTCVWDVTGSQPIVPAIECYETATWNSVTCDYDITGSQPAAPTVECYETATWNGVTCVWDITGSQPIAPAIECYETATWNSVTCDYDITGSQPAAPTVECYETATWNGVTCVWDVTGSQPIAPAIECYETATWNGVTCVWDITGSQPAAPTVECYETATWNGVTCVWDITGSQPVQPAIECYETATWNGVTCVWDITGSQPVQPAIECYETATWNGVTCVWDVTGSQPVQPAMECYETATWNANICDWIIHSTTRIIPIFTAINSICQGEIINSLPTTSNNGITGSWSPAIDNTQTTTYTFTPDEGQCAQEITLDIVVNEKPTLTLFANRTEITCKEPTATITANASGGAIPYRYRINNLWSVNNNFTIETGGVVDITMEDNNQCTANAQITISENKPSPIVTVKTIPAVCYPATIDLANAIVTSNASINKYFSTSNLSSELSSTIVQGVTNKTFYVAGFDMQTGCMGNATAIPVQINELNVQHIGDTIVCENNTVRLWARGMGEQATQYKYDFYRTGNNPSYAVANSTQNRYIESITTTNGNILYNIGVQNGACQYTQSVNITTIPSPVIQVEESSEGVKTIVENETHPPYLYRYDNGNWQTSPWFHLHEKGTYTVTVANARGCETTVPFIVNRALDIIPALFFSPNNDGVNDTWEIENIGHYPHAIIEIYDRFSKLLITYKGNETGWDGMYLGYPMPMTDYWYIITIPELGKPRTGHFTLKR